MQVLYMAGLLPRQSLQVPLRSKYNLPVISSHKSSYYFWEPQRYLNGSLNEHLVFTEVGKSSSQILWQVLHKAHPRHVPLGICSKLPVKCLKRDSLNGNPPPRSCLLRCKQTFLFNASSIQKQAWSFPVVPQIFEVSSHSNASHPRSSS